MATDGLARRLADDFTRKMLATIGVTLPDYALRISDLVSLNKRVDFVEQFVPDFERRALACAQGQDRQESASSWIDERLVTYGKDARALVGDAMAAYLQSERQRIQADAAAHQRQQCLDIMEAVFFGLKNGNPDAT